MKPRKFFIFALVLISASIFLSRTNINAVTVPSAYGFDVSIFPEPGKEGVFQAKLVLSELASAKIVASPTIRFRAGQLAETTMGEAQDGFHFKFSVSVDERGSLAEYTAVVSDSTTEISRSQARISLTN